MEENQELADEELEKVVGGAPRRKFLEWAAELYNLHRREQHDKQINEDGGECPGTITRRYSPPKEGLLRA